MFKGSIVALITPFRNGAVDESALAKLVDWHVAEGTHGIVPCGTTGESPTLTHDEHMRVTELVVRQAANRIPVIAGTGSNSTREAVSLTRHAEEVGADAALLVTPYYNKPNAEGVYQHFKAVHDATNLPLLVYNIPPRSVIDVQPEQMARLADLPRIVGVKDATADLTRPSRHRHLIGKDFIQLSGEDGTTLGFMAHGGRGCISVTANVAPKLCSEFQEACLSGDYASALHFQDRLMPLHTALFLEPSPGPVKYAASLLGLCEDTLRLPMVPPAEATRVRVTEAMRHAGLLN